MKGICDGKNILFTITCWTIEVGEKRCECLLVVSPPADRVRVNGLPDLHDAGGLHGALRFVKLEASGAHSKPHQATIARDHFSRSETTSS